MTTLRPAPARPAALFGGLDPAVVADFLAGRSGPEALPEPAWGPIGKEVYERTYSRDDTVVGPDGAPRKETWAETVRRVVKANLGYAPAETRLPGEELSLFALIYSFGAIPAGRHLWVSGTKAETFGSRNCWCSGWEERTSAHVRFLASRLFEGGGVGANYSADLLAVTSPIVTPVTLAVTARGDHPDIEAIRAASGDAFLDPTDIELAAGSEVIRAEDTREGWVEVWCRIIDASTEGSPDGARLRFLLDVSDVRPHGALLRTFGGRASGPAPLVSAALGVARVLNAAAGEHRRLNGLEAMAIDHEVAASVVAGGARRCLPEGTRVHTTRGPVKIEDVHIGDMVQTVAGTAPVTATFDQGVQRTVRIRHEFGALECTPNHRVAVFGSLTGWIFKEASQLAPGDHLVWDPNGTEGQTGAFPAHDAIERLDVDGAYRRVNGEPRARGRFATPCSIEGCGERSQVLTPDPLCNHHYLRKMKYGDPLYVTARRGGFTVPELNPDTAWLIGFFHGNGSVVLDRSGARGAAGVSCDARYPRVIDHVRKVFEVFGVDHLVEHGPTPRDGSKKLTARRVEVARWFHANVKQSHQPISVPEWIFAASRDVRGAYLAGLFDADGSWKTRPLLMVATVYEGLADDVIRLLASLGIASYKKLTRAGDNEDGWRPLWNVHVAGQDALSMVEQWFAVYSRKYEPSGRKVEGHRGFGFSKEFGRNNGLPSYGGAGNTRYTVPVIERLGKVRLDAWPVRVLGIESGRQVQTYDIEVDGLHQFTAEGFVVHNSARMSLMHWRDPQVLDFVACKSDQLHHWTTNISVEIDTAFAEALCAGDRHAAAVLEAVAAGMAANGEPGLIDTEAHSVGEPVRIRNVNPCLWGDTRMLTRDGLVPIRELAGTSFEVWNGQEWSRSTAWSTGVKPVFEVALSNGLSIKATGNHIFATADGDEVAVEDLAGRQMQVFPGSPWEGSDPYSHDEALLLGFLQGDGSKRKDGAVVIQNSEPEAAHPLTAFGFHRQSSGEWYAGTSSAAAALVAKAEMLDERLPDRRLPGWLFSARPETVRAFLRGLYSANGSALRNHRRVTLKSTCRGLVGEVQQLLAALGVSSYITTNKPTPIEWQNGTYTSRESYDLNIANAAGLALFRSEIGFLQEHKTAIVDGYRFHRAGHPTLARVVSVVPAGNEEVFDFTEPGRHWGWANGFQAHNCQESSLATEGARGEACNLGSVNLDFFGADLDGAVEAVKLVARFLLRATLNVHPDPDAGAIEARNRRIGVGIMGVQGWMAAHGSRLSELPDDIDRRADLGVMRVAARAAADELADELGIPRPVKVTAIAPTGTIAQMPGVTPGVHPVFARHFIRRVRYSDTDPALADLAAAGYRIVDDIYAASTKVVEFPVSDAILERFDPALVEQADEIDVESFLALIAAAQETFCAGSDGQSVSATAQIPTGADPAALAGALRRAIGRVKGIAVFPDVSRDLSPLERIDEDYYRLLAARVGGPLAVGDSNDGECRGASCPIR